MMTRRLGTTAVAVLISSLIVTGCNGDSGEEEPTGQANPPSPHPTATESPTTPTSTTEPPAPEASATTEPPVTEEPTASSREQDLLDIAETSQAFEDHISAIAFGHEPLEHLNLVAAEQAREIWAHALRGDLEAGWLQLGTVTVEVLHVQWITNDQVTTHVCVDVSEVDVVDEDGNSVVDPGRPDRQSRERELRRTDGRGMYSWIVTDDRGSGAPCDE